MKPLALVVAVAATTAALLLPMRSAAQPTGILLEPGGAVVNRPTKVVIDFAAAERWCGLRVDFGDGDVSDLLVEQFPLTIVRRYTAAGRYMVRAEGRALLRGAAFSPPCTGARRSALITVAESSGNDSAPARARPVEPRSDSPGRRGAEDKTEDDAGKRQETPQKDKRQDKREDKRNDPPENKRQDKRDEDDGSTRRPGEPPVRATPPAVEPAARQAKPAADPARAPASPRKPARDESLKVF
jgi:hypothetical protein